MVFLIFSEILVWLDNIWGEAGGSFVMYLCFEGMAAGIFLSETTQ